MPWFWPRTLCNVAQIYIGKAYSTLSQASKRYRKDHILLKSYGHLGSSVILWHPILFQYRWPVSCFIQSISIWFFHADHHFSFPDTYWMPFQSTSKALLLSRIHITLELCSDMEKSPVGSFDSHSSTKFVRGTLVLRVHLPNRSILLQNVSSPSSNK